MTTEKRLQSLARQVQGMGYGTSAARRIIDRGDWQDCWLVITRRDGLATRSSQVEDGYVTVVAREYVYTGEVVWSGETQDYANVDDMAMVRID